jgi:DNA-binding MarR family transcriptional regulator
MVEGIMRFQKQFRAMHRLYRRNMLEALSKNDLYFGQPPILFALLDRGACTQKEISEQLDVSQATVAVSVRRLLKAGFLTKVKDTKDQRRNRIELTQMGRVTALACRKDIDDIFVRMCAGFSEKETDELTALLGRLGDNINSKCRGGKGEG